MAQARDIALQIVPHLAANVLRGHVQSYGHYAKAIGRDPRRDGLAIGQAMHSIGAVCVLMGLPVAPLHWVKPDKGEQKQVFVADPTERAYVLPHFDTLYIASREYRWTQEDFAVLESKVRDVLVGEAPPTWTPHVLWQLACREKVKGSDHTYLEAALERYAEIIEGARARRRGQKGAS